jgi:putative endonuclease
MSDHAPGTMMRTYYVYMLASPSGVPYTGVTNNIQRRIVEHRRKLIAGFTRKYNVTKLVHYEVFGEIRSAIAREKQIKAWTRQKRVALIESQNPKWADLTADWFPDPLPE